MAVAAVLYGNIEKGHSSHREALIRDRQDAAQLSSSQENPSPAAQGKEQEP